MPHNTDVPLQNNGTASSNTQMDPLLTLETVISCTPGHVYWKDINGVYLGCNDNFAAILHLPSRQSIIGKTAYDILSKRLADHITSIDKQVIQSNKTITTEEIGPGYQGNKTVYYTKKQPLYNAQGEIIGLIGIAFDITRQKKADKIAKDYSVIQKTVDILRTLAGSIAHEIKTPIAGLKVNLELLGNTLKKIIPEQSPNTPAQQDLTFIQKLLFNLNKGVESCTSIINIQLQNMAYGKINTHEFVECSMRSLIETSIKTYPLTSTQKKLIVRFPEQDFMFLGSTVLIQHVIWNLLKNALEAIKESEHCSLTIWLQHTESYNYVYFKDTGQGIPAKQLSKIFDTFYTTRRNGSGLGLPYCKLVMEAHQGDISCESRENEYTLFILRFPAIHTTQKTPVQSNARDALL